MYIGHQFWSIFEKITSRLYKKCTKEEHSPSEFYYPDEDTEANEPYNIDLACSVCTVQTSRSVNNPLIFINLSSS